MDAHPSDSSSHCTGISDFCLHLAACPAVAHWRLPQLVPPAARSSKESQHHLAGSRCRENAEVHPSACFTAVSLCATVWAQHAIVQTVRVILWPCQSSLYHLNPPGAYRMHVSPVE